MNTNSHDLRVKNFCCLKEVHLKFRPTTILIGPQASGKSLLAKLCYFFRQALSELPVEITSCTNQVAYGALLQARFKRFFPPQTWGRRFFEICYSIDGFETKISRSGRGENIRIEFSDSLKELFNKISDVWTKFKERPSLRGPLEFDSDYRGYVIYRRLRKHLPAAILTSLLFVPAGRSFFTNLDSAIWPILRKQGAIDPFLIEFGLHYQSSKHMLRYERASATKRVKGRARLEQKLWKVFGGALKVRGEDDFFQLDDGRSIPLANLSSGQQELLPLLLAFKSQAFSLREPMPTSAIFIEEPEAHLFPSAQKNIVEFVVAVFNALNERSQLVVTTHSPYVLSTINNLLMAHAVAKQGGATIVAKVKKVIPIECWVSFESVAAYVVSDGVATTIVDAETSLIDQSFIDSVSSDISDDFERLVDLMETSNV